jgi:thymidylate synthase (FAD)
MKIIQASAKIISIGNYYTIEDMARTCTQSGDKCIAGEGGKFIRALIEKGHESPLEHVSATVRFICDRGTSHEIVRHRLASFTQESTRFCKYDEITFIRPPFWADVSDVYKLWKIAMENAEKAYMELLALRSKPECARTVLPTSTKTELRATANLREWRHILNLRCGYDNHPAMRDIMLPLLKDFYDKAPDVFADIAVQHHRISAEIPLYK